MVMDYLKYGMSNFLWTIGLFISLVIYIKSVKSLYKGNWRKRGLSYIDHIITTSILAVTCLGLVLGLCYFMYSDTKNYQAVQSGYTEFEGVYVGIKDLNDYPNRRTVEIALQFKDIEGTVLEVTHSYFIYNRFKNLEPLKTYKVHYFKEDLIKEITLVENP